MRGTPGERVYSGRDRGTCQERGRKSRVRGKTCARIGQARAEHATLSHNGWVKACALGGVVTGSGTRMGMTSGPRLTAEVPAVTPGLRATRNGPACMVGGTASGASAPTPPTAARPVRFAVGLKFLGSRPPFRPIYRSQWGASAEVTGT